LLKAASPAEVKSGGEGQRISLGIADSPFGKCLIGKISRGICFLTFIDSKKEKGAIALARKEWPLARLLRDDVLAARLARRIFRSLPNGVSGSSVLPVFVKGTPFQIAVWEALLGTPRGTLVTYGRLAAAVGKSSAARAVGSAVGRNPVAYLIPCHRVICRNGAIGGYRWGRGRKQVMIAWEASRS
jgi:AraC family transcriptional regulator of adaptative response/methylated-DNA-[protein]-cysteine methyltransferase